MLRSRLDPVRPQTTPPTKHLFRQGHAPPHRIASFRLLLLKVCRRKVINTITLASSNKALRYMSTRLRKPSKRITSILANNVIGLRKAQALSQEQLSEKCRLHRTYIGSVERGERNVTLSTLEVFAAALGVTVTQLLTENRAGDNGVHRVLDFGVSKIRAHSKGGLRANQP